MPALIVTDENGYITRMNASLTYRVRPNATAFLYVTNLGEEGTDVYTYSFRQLPWSENSLGFVKINFPNKDAVYMHDTPLKSLFGRNVRFESSGCVRVHNVEGLVTWILRDTPGWSLERVLSMKQSGEQADVKLSTPMPVYFVYISAWATPDGVVNFRPDIYNHDGSAETASNY